MNSVTMEIRDAEQFGSLTTDAGRLILFSAVNEAFGPLPERPYTVTYEVADDGMEVRNIYEDEDEDTPPGEEVESGVVARGGRKIAVCRLPHEWIGKCVTRRVHDG